MDAGVRSTKASLRQSPAGDWTSHAVPPCEVQALPPAETSLELCAAGSSSVVSRSFVWAGAEVGNQPLCHAGLGVRPTNPTQAVHQGLATDQLTRLDAQAARSGMRLAVDWVDGEWRAGFLETNELGEAEFVLHATGPDGGTAIGRLVELAADLD